MSEEYIKNLERALAVDFLNSAEAVDIDEDNITDNFRLDVEDDLPVIKVLVEAPNDKGRNFFSAKELEENIMPIQGAFADHLEQGKTISDPMVRQAIKYYHDCLAKARILEDIIFEQPRTERANRMFDDLYQDFLKREDQRIEDSHASFRNNNPSP